MTELPASLSVRTVPVSALGPEDEKLCRKAAEVAGTAYDPYSKFSVGAAVRTMSGKEYVGSNLENAVYGLGICAEVSAVTAANSAGDFGIEAIAIVGHPKDNPAAGENIVTPCGRCRQIIFEASHISRKDVRVFCCNGDLSKCRSYVISELLPDGFGPENLGIDLSRYRATQSR